MFGKSGSGKTYSALLYMRGIVGPKGKIKLIDTESGRGSLFADIPEIGGYKVLDLDPPFSPERYQEALELAEKDADGVVYDSLTHEHNGEGGLLDMQEAELHRMAGDDYRKREACKMASWIKPKIAHKKFIARLLRCKLPLICCLRGEEKTHMVKDGDKNKVITDQFSTPIFDQRFIFEMLVNFETIERDGKGGYVIPRKITHPKVAPLLPRPDQQITVAHGAALMAWCNGTAGAAKAPTLDRKALLVELRDLTSLRHGWTKGMSASAWTTAKAKLQDWLNTIGIVPELDNMTAEQLSETITKIRTIK
jgi:hypothetical protein